MLVLALLLQSAPLAYVEQVDPMTDKVRIFAAAVSENGSIAIGCEKGKGVRIALLTDHYLHMPARVVGFAFWDSRVDQQPKLTSPWEVDDRHSAHIDGAKQVADFIRPMLSGSQLRVRAETIGEEPFDLVFDIAGAKPTLDRVLAQCDADGIRRRLPSASVSASTAAGTP